MDDKQYFTIYNSHVLSCAKVIGYIGLGLSGFGCCMSVITLNLTNLLMGGLTLLVYACVVYACRRNDPKLYLPFLVINAVTITFNAAYITFLGIMVVTMPKYWERELDREDGYNEKELSQDEHTPAAVSQESSFERDIRDLHQAARVTTAVILALMIIVECLSIWFQMIVWRAYRYMKAESTNLIPPDVFVRNIQ